MFKRFFTLLLIVLMSIESIGAVVSDNDGSAFITKAEFDSLKNNFQSQIDQYNTSIDSKIDGAIASYLAGINVSKKRVIDNVVSNYNDIYWIPNWKLYGRYKHWTSNTNIDRNEQDVWFTPPTERRMILRDKNLELYDSCYQAFANWIVYAQMRVQYFDGSVIPASGGWVAGNGYEQTPPVGYISQIWNSNYNQYIIEDNNNFWSNLWMLNYEIYTNTHTFEQKLSGQDPYMNKWCQLRAIEPYLGQLAGSADDILHYQYSFYAVDYNSRCNLTSRLNLKNTNFPTVYIYGSNAYTTAGSNQTGYNDTTHGLGRDTRYWALVNESNWFDAGVTWVQIKSNLIQAQKNMMVYGMFGKNTEQNYNILRWANSTKSGGAPIDFTETDRYSTLETTVSRYQVSNPAMSIKNNGTAYVENPGAQINIRCPLLPVMKLKNLTGGKFIYDGKPLNMGSGLPIATGLDQKGYAQIEFDYVINRVGETNTFTNNTDLYVSLKNGDYLTSDLTDDYYKGYAGLVDPGATTSAALTFNNLKYEGRDGKIKISVPVEKDKTIWFRMYPDNETGGFYAKMSNLKITYFIE